MPSAITLRSDFSAAELRRLARRIKNAVQARSLLALAAIHDGGTRSEATRLGHVNLRIVRDWVVRFNAEGPDGLIGRRAPGPTTPLTDRAPPGAGGAGRPRPDPHSLWRGALAAVRTWPMAMGEFRVSVSMQTACTGLHFMCASHASFAAMFASPTTDASAPGGRKAVSDVCTASSAFLRFGARR